MVYTIQVLNPWDLEKRIRFPQWPIARGELRIWSSREFDVKFETNLGYELGDPEGSFDEKKIEVENLTSLNI